MRVLSELNNLKFACTCQNAKSTLFRSRVPQTPYSRWFRLVVIYNGSEVQNSSIIGASLFDIALIPNSDDRISSGSGRNEVVLV